MERVEQRHGRVSRLRPWGQERLRALLREQPDRTLGELQRRLREQMQVSVSSSRLWVVLQQRKLRLPKSRYAQEQELPENRPRRLGLGGEGVSLR